jgi:hypothetical protein
MTRVVSRGRICMQQQASFDILVRVYTDCVIKRMTQMAEPDFGDLETLVHRDLTDPHMVPRK